MYNVSIIEFFTNSAGADQFRIFLRD